MVDASPLVPVVVTAEILGAHVAARPEVARAIVAAGHAVGNHSYTHPQDVPGSQPRGAFDLLPESTQADQMDTTTERIVEATGVQPVLFRAPAGCHFAAPTRQLAARRGMAVVHWSTDTGDWRAPGQPSASYQDVIVATATTEATGRTTHPILMMHDGKASAEPEERYVFIDPLGQPR